MITQKIHQRALEDPLKEAIVRYDCNLNYQELSARVKALSYVLSEVPKQVIVFHSDVISNLCGVLACNELGKAAIVLPEDFSSESIKNLVDHSDAALFISDQEIRFSDGDLTNTGVHESVFVGILSSGSTSEPKLIWKTNDNWEAAFVHQSEVFGISEQDRIFVLDALAYSANLNAAVHCLWQGATLVLGEFEKARGWSQLFLEERVSSVFLVPSHCRILTKQNFQYPGLKSLVTAGEKLDSITAKALLAKFPSVLLSEYYGAAELGHISYHQNRDIIDYPTSVGKAFPGVKIDIQEDQIIVRSDYVSPEYAGKSTVHDIGFFEQGRLILLGRAGRIFNRRGLNIFAQEIENVALDCGLVQEAVLIARKDEQEVTRLTLYFTSNQTQETNEFELRQFLLENLPASKQPNFVKELTVIPHSDAGKVDFRALSKICDETEEQLA